MVLVRPRELARVRAWPWLTRRGFMFSKFNFLLAYPFLLFPRLDRPLETSEKSGDSVLYLTPS